MWTNGACGNGGAGIIIVFQGPKRVKLHYATKLAFIVTNNAVEYEAMIMALEIIKEVGILHSTIHCNSQLVVNHCQGHFKVRDPSLAKYEEKV